MVAAADAAIKASFAPPVPEFFVPHIPDAKAAAIHQGIAALVKDQLRLTMTTRRIYSLKYIQNKKRHTAVVGQIEEHERRYDILAIYEGPTYVVYTRATDGGAGLTILVNKDEIISVEDFAR